MTNIELTITAVYMQAIEISLKNHGLKLSKKEIVEYCAYSRKTYHSESFWMNKIPWVFDVLERDQYNHVFDGKGLRPVDSDEVWVITAEALGMILNYDDVFVEYKSPGLKNALIEVFEHLYLSYDDDTKRYIKFVYDFGFTDFQSILNRFKANFSTCESLLKKIEEDNIKINENGPNCNFYDIFEKENKGLKKYVELIKEIYPDN